MQRQLPEWLRRRTIRQWLDAGYEPDDIAQAYGVTLVYVRRIQLDKIASEAVQAAKARREAADNE